MRKPRFAIACCITILVAGCSSLGGKEEKDAPQRSLDTLYNSGLDKLSRGKNLDAVKDFEELERVYPASDWAGKARLMAGFAQYQAKEYDDAVLTFEGFLKLHPASKQADYAMYMIGLCYYEQISDVRRDQGITYDALRSFGDLTTRFPRSSYSRDAKFKVDLLRDHLAGKEMEIGRFYLKKGNQTAAINRFQKVIEEYQTTSHVTEALYRIVEAYWAMGVKEEAKKYAAVLGYNYPGSIWYMYAYKLVDQK